MPRAPTERQAEAMALRDQGLNYAEIGKKLGVSARTVDIHLSQFRMRQRKAVISPRELEVFNLLRTGLTIDEVGDQLGISGRTAETLKQRLLDKFDAKNFTHLVAMFADQTINDLRQQIAERDKKLASVRTKAADAAELK